MKDLTQGKVLKTLILFSIPMMIGSIFQLLYSTIDSVIVGNVLGVKELAGVGATGSLNFFIIGFANGMASGCCIMVARQFGAKNMPEMKKAIGHTMVLGSLVAIFLSVLSTSLLHLILTVMNTPADVIGFADTYIRIIFSGMIITMWYNLISGILRSVGDSKTPLYFLIISSILNIFLDLFFMAVLSMGVAGAAVATLISQLVSVLLCIIYTVKKYPEILPSLHDYKLEWAMSRDLLSHGTILGFQTSLIAVGNVCVQTALNSLGSTYMAANTAANKISHIFMQPLSTVGAAMGTFAPQNLGAGKIDRIRKGLVSSNILIFSWAAFSGLVSFVFGPWLISLLIRSDAENFADVIRYGSTYLRWHLVFFLFLGPLYLYRNTLQGIGNKTIPFLSGILELVFKIAAVLWITPNFGYSGICATEPFAWVLCALLLGIAFYFDPRVRKMNERSVSS